MGLIDRFRMTSKVWAKTIVAFESPHRLQDLGTQGHQDSPSVESNGGDMLKIRLAHTSERIRDASVLVQKRYGEAGYQSVGGGPNKNVCPEQITLLSYHKDKVVGTLTLGLDIGQGLYADELYKPEIDKLRSEGRKVAEITKLAVDSKLPSKRILAALIHIAYIYGARIWRYTDVVIEVNPSHAEFYKRMLGFRAIGEERLCTRVNAPAVLLWVESRHLKHKIAEFGGGLETGRKERSLFPYFFSQSDELEITHRLVQNEHGS